LIAGRTAQGYNRRKARWGAFWEDRYHATAIQSGAHLHRCVVYIDLNMVRAGVVKHPAEWPHGGYLEIQQPPERYRVIDLLTLSGLCGFDDIREFQKVHREWVEAASSGDAVARDDRWSESIAVGSESFVEQVKVALGFKAQHRQVAVADGLYTLREWSQPYGDHFDGENEAVRANNAVPWQITLDTTEA
jgi:putative transposase